MSIQTMNTCASIIGCPTGYTGRKKGNMYMEDVTVIGEHKDVAIYMKTENGKRRYRNGVNPFESFNTLDETLHDIDVALLIVNY